MYIYIYIYKVDHRILHKIDVFIIIMWLSDELTHNI